ncbi:MAG: glutathione S-transferase family protein [Immundisolibacteraceae bacterium]|nr:glutathione S-transferase family protein [Immundisolibacteraceae bacterium]
MKIYQDASAPNPRRVRIFLAEKALAIPYENVELSKKEQLTNGFLAINPYGELPVLELDDGTHIAETMAICRYLELLHPDPALFGTSPVEQATIEMWNRRMELHLLLNIAHCFQHSHPFFADTKPQVLDYAAIARQRAETHLDRLNTLLGSRPYIAGESFSVADITAVCAIDFARVVKIRIADSADHLNQWHKRVSDRPSISA